MAGRKKNPDLMDALNRPSKAEKHASMNFSDQDQAGQLAGALAFNFNLDFLGDQPAAGEDEISHSNMVPQDHETGPGAPEETGKKARVVRGSHRHHTRRFTGEQILADTLDWHFNPGESWHVLSHGDVDLLSFLRFMVRQQRLEYCLVSTWVMGMTDAIELAGWLAKGYVKRYDIYGGELFRNQYAAVFGYLLANTMTEHSRIATFRNHAKVIAGFGEHYDFVIESSANINTNPRVEQTTITIDTDVALFYKRFFDDIQPFNRMDSFNFKPWEREPREG